MDETSCLKHVETVSIMLENSGDDPCISDGQVGIVAGPATEVANFLEGVLVLFPFFGPLPSS